MWRYSEASEAKLRQLDPQLARVMREVIKLMDVTIVTGYRIKSEQDRLYAEGKSKLQYPDSKHNTFPSRAVDVAPYPYDEEDRERFTYMAGMVLGVALRLGIKLRWGGDWDQDGEVKDNSFDDLFHFELAD